MWRLLFVLAVFLFNGCAIQQQKQFHCQVSSFSSPNYSKGGKYVILSAKKEISVNDLEFMEYAKYLDTILLKNGLQPASSFDEANVVVFFGYGISDPKHEQYSYSVPEYGMKGGGTTSFTTTTYGQRGIYNSYGTAYSPPEFGVTGYSQVSGVDTYFTRHILLDAYNLDVYRQSKELKPLWKVVVTSSGSSGDLRYVFPYLATSFDGFVGTNSKEAIKIVVPENDPRVLQLKASH